DPLLEQRQQLGVPPHLHELRRPPPSQCDHRVVPSTPFNLEQPAYLIRRLPYALVGVLLDLPLDGVRVELVTQPRLILRRVLRPRRTRDVPRRQATDNHYSHPPAHTVLHNHRPLT